MNMVKRLSNSAYRAAALEVAISPSGCAILCIAVGAKQIGEATFTPRIVVSVLILLTSTRILGSKRNLEYALRFSLRVTISFEPLA